MRPAIKPYRQGQLDGLCGVYAIVNAIRLSVEGRSPALTCQDWAGLFYALLSFQDEEFGGLLDVIINGMTVKRLRKTARHAVRYILAEYDVEIAIRRLFPKGYEPGIGDLIAKIAAVTSAGTPVIVDLSGRLNHWTVVRCVSATSLLLFDSAGHRWVRIANCVLNEDPDGGTKHVLSIRSIFATVVTQNPAAATVQDMFGNASS